MVADTALDYMLPKSFNWEKAWQPPGSNRFFAIKTRAVTGVRTWIKHQLEKLKTPCSKRGSPTGAFHRDAFVGD